ncbi:MAG: BMP family ABC transporter substrate-binding protein [Chloroflexota bacterium]|nr:MAG: BMP family ABC transporter substrate-binding protein [Chloroflexota bacterium]
MRISTRLLALGASAAIAFAACGGGASPSPTGATPTDAPSGEPTAPPESAATMDWKACVAFDTGGLGDKGFNDLAKKGLEDAAAAGYETAFSEAQGATDYAANIQRLIDEGCQTIVTVGFLQSQATADAAIANPEVAFAQVDTAWNTAGPDFIPGNEDDTPIPPNFTGLDYQIDQAAMLAGYLAAGFSESGKIGTYGGQQFPGVTRFMDGMYAGIAYYNEQKGTNVVLLGWDGDSTGTFVGGDNPWNDPAKGEQLAQALLDQGVDIVHPVAGATGNGSIKAMLDAGKWAIGVDTDQAISLAEYAGAILTSAQKAIDVSVLDVIAKNAGGNLGGEDYSGTLFNEGVLISPYHEFESVISAELQAEVETLKDQLSKGEISVCEYLARGC